MLLWRTISTLVLAPLVLLLLWYGNALVFVSTMAAVAARLLYEWYLLRSPRQWLAYLISTGVAWTLLVTLFVGRTDLIVTEISLLLLLLLSWRLWSYQPGQVVLTDPIDRSIIGLIYCVVPLLQMNTLHALPQGKEWLLYLLMVVWGTDIGAYLVGRLMGRHKMAPVISPGKSWEGACGGLVAGALAGWSIVPLLSLTLATESVMMLSIVVSVASQVGDLIESLFKREAGVKDSRALIPGHGGLLDRLDSLLFAVPVLFVYLMVLR
ncbi:MAG: phosphatidate cytidylyltransferase [Magnetococcales bacterium]|nr:phosphatidate cytidylyltransferase [Magnetococcales bacterium]